MSQSADIVKSAHLDTDTSLVDSIEPSTRLRPLAISADVLKHPFFFKGTSSISPFVFGKKQQWGYDGRNTKGGFEAKDIAAVGSVVFQWDPAWTDVPQWLLDVLATPQRKASVWLDVKPSDVSALNEQWCRWAVQLGWSWWLSSPRSGAELLQHLDNSKHLWRFWFTNSSSDQWIWPWCNILLRENVRRLNAYVSLPRDWVADSRQKNAWIAAEDEAWKLLAVVVGGEPALLHLIASVSELVNNGQLKHKT